MGNVNVTIDGKVYSVDKDKTILAAARENHINIPTLCHFEGLDAKANCRICVVEVEGMRTLQPACATKVNEGMVMLTASEKVVNARKATLELILAHHAVDCHHCLRIGSSDEQSLDPSFCEMCFWCDCERDGFCELQSLAREYHVDVLPYVQYEKDYEVDCSLGSIVRNPNKCIKCKRCVDVCSDMQSVHNLSLANRGRDTMVVPELGKTMAESACVRCGHCVDVCPTGALYLKEHMNEVLFHTHAYHDNTIAMVSGNVVTKLEELYKLQPNTISVKNIVAALRKIGFDKVISDTRARSIVAEQAASIIESKVAAGPVIITNSCAVMNFVDEYFSDKKNLINVYDSIQTAFGKIAKEYKKENPIYTVNITATKEAGAEAKETSNVDFVLNERELYRMFIRTGGAPARKKPQEFDDFKVFDIKYPELLEDLKWNMSDCVEEIEVVINGEKKKCAIAHNLGQVRKMLEGGYKEYDVIRLMA
ncbi:MAG: 4Fe-4S dicluster domain-containing protein [Nostocales cyanobacterium W4_Combined_metabat2_030]|nr:4Fe-4S dicluster domain-containing protein [Nostocales cyanobacterium W4_Combined_metabat2_030]